MTIDKCPLCKKAGLTYEHEGKTHDGKTSGERYTDFINGIPSICTGVKWGEYKYCKRCWQWVKPEKYEV